MSPQQTIAHYRIVAKIGEGGMGEVYRAVDTKLGREVAIKVIPETYAQDADRMARFGREAQVLASLNHPNIAAIYGVEERALVMELVDGPTLEDRIAEGPIPVAEALGICRQIAEALEYAHEKGIVHRDLKPANVKLTSEGTAKVLDFGLAKALANESIAGDSVSSPTMTMRATMAGMIMGTAAYMSPEQARGLAVDRRADIWSFGVMFYEMLTGRRMFQGETISDTLAAVLKTDPDWSALPAGTPPAIRRLLRRCLERDRKRRLPDIATARLEIDEPLEPSAAAAPTRTFKWWNAAIALVALAGLAVAFVHFRETPPQPVPMRFQIPAPDKSNFGNTGMALSPDGRRLAFIATGADGRQMLWVRPLDAVAAQPLAATEGANFMPFWSPDSHSIGFVVQGRLKRIEASGGPSQTLCVFPGTLLGGSWGRDGTIIFGSAGTGIFGVSQAGGAATQLTTPDESNGELAHMRPWFLPDGRHFFYVSRNRVAGAAGIYVATLEGHTRKRLVSTVQMGAYAPPFEGSKNGHLLFLREGTLMALPLDPKTYEPAGEPLPVAEQGGYQLAMGLFSVSANGVLAYRAGGTSGTSQIVWIDRQGNTVGKLGPAQLYSGGIGGPTLSPDGKRAAVDQVDPVGTTRDVWILDVARGVPTRFTFSGAENVSPTWSPHGNRLFFASERGGGRVYDIYQKDSSGSRNEELLLKSHGEAYANDASPDGRYLLYTASGQKLELWLLPVQESTSTDRKPVPYLQANFNESQGQFSPDGHWIAYISDESGPYQIYVQSFPAGGGKFQISTGAGGTQPRWRRDGKEIFYIGADGKLMAVDVKTVPVFEAGVPRELFDSQILGTASPTLFRYDVAADGKRFLISNFIGARERGASPPITIVLNWYASLKR